MWNQGVPDATAQFNVLDSLFRSHGLLQKKIADAILGFSTVNWTDVSIPAQPTGNISQQCQKDVAQYEADLFQGKNYALQTAPLSVPLSLTVLDSGGKPPSGILNGNLFWLGSYSQCVNITRKGFNITFDGKFYLATLVPVPQAKQSQQLTEGVPILPGSPLNLILGVCVPSSCSQHDVIQRLDGSIYWRFLVQHGILQVTSAYSQESPPIQSVTIAAICICGVILFLLTSGTIYDVIIHQPRLLLVKAKKESEAQDHDIAMDVSAPDEKTPLVNKTPRDLTSAPTEGMTVRILLCFSLYTNIGKLLSTKQAPGSIRCLHGIRFISMTWVILGHTYYFGTFGLALKADNLLESSEIMQSFTFQAIRSATVSVDSFFFLSSSGLLMSYLLLRQIGKSIEKGESIPYGMLYFHRYWRLTPTYLFVMMLWTWVLPYMFSGPFWPPAPIDPNCGQNWWTNLLYINNVVNNDKMCMGWTWYLANDMQFFVIGVPLVYAVYRWKKLGIALLLTLLLVSFVTTAIICLHYHFTIATGDQIHYYFVPYCRIGPYLVGVAVGWLLTKMRRKETRNTTLSLLMPIGWLVAAASAMAVLYSTYGQYSGTTFQTESENVLYLTVHRTVWAMAVGWMVVACYYGYGGYLFTAGVVHIILSWDAWVPLSRLTYCAYLVHILVMYAVHLTREVPIHYSTFTIIYFFLGHLAVSYGVAFLVSVAVETPLLGLEKIIFKK
ncbi:nose resistant to fluoxetine protein 6-like [Branchiostoma floridae]|uniref:Nose resistant to fluoxetine protein 6-like n=1 Tax=Branchiostoma floridae TaxID=7739 RepID=A0A9J7N1R6_BRAFL|nr:nose resistant to fluoxetine protein 6-like [Branchiostoma floridae]